MSMNPEDGRWLLSRGAVIQNLTPQCDNGGLYPTSSSEYVVFIRLALTIVTDVGKPSEIDGAHVCLVKARELIRATSKRFLD